MTTHQGSTSGVVTAPGAEQGTATAGAAQGPAAGTAQVPVWLRPVDCSRCRTPIRVDAPDVADLPTFLTSTTYAPLRPGYTRPEVSWRCQADSVPGDRVAAYLCRECVDALRSWIYSSPPPPGAPHGGHR